MVESIQSVTSVIWQLKGFILATQRQAGSKVAVSIHFRPRQPTIPLLALANTLRAVQASPKEDAGERYPLQLEVNSRLITSD